MWPDTKKSEKIQVPKTSRVTLTEVWLFCLSDSRKTLMPKVLTFLHGINVVSGGEPGYLQTYQIHHSIKVTTKGVRNTWSWLDPYTGIKSHSLIQQSER